MYFPPRIQQRQREKGSKSTTHKRSMIFVVCHEILRGQLNFNKRGRKYGAAVTSVLYLKFIVPILPSKL
jgi:hypothetical protein